MNFLLNGTSHVKHLDSVLLCLPANIPMKVRKRWKFSLTLKTMAINLMLKPEGTFVANRSLGSRLKAQLVAYFYYAQLRALKNSLSSYSHPWSATWFTKASFVSNKNLGRCPSTSCLLPLSVAIMFVFSCFLFPYSQAGTQTLSFF